MAVSRLGVELDPGTVRWLSAERSVGQNVGNRETHLIFVDLKESAPPHEPNTSDEPLGPTEPKGR